jgi:N-acylglucosamine 2-epimerase
MADEPCEGASGMAAMNSARPDDGPDWRFLAGQCRSALLEDVIPFWLRHSLDEEYGGYLHHLDRDGSIYCTDKMMWMQGRQVWMLSHLWQIVERRSSWLEAARLGADFMRAHGRDERGGWYFLVDRQGSPIKAAANIYSDFFAVLGLSEYALASGETWALDMAVETFWQIIARRDNPKGRYNKSLPRPDTPGDLAFQMMLLQIARHLHALAPDERLEELARNALLRITTRHVDGARRFRARLGRRFTAGLARREAAVARPCHREHGFRHGGSPGAPSARSDTPGRRRDALDARARLG